MRPIIFVGLPQLRDKMGIASAPIEVVDYVARSADVLSRNEFGRWLPDKGVQILEAFQSGWI